MLVLCYAKIAKDIELPILSTFNTMSNSDSNNSQIYPKMSLIYHLFCYFVAQRAWNHQPNFYTRSVMHFWYTYLYHFLKVSNSFVIHITKIIGSFPFKIVPSYLFFPKFLADDLTLCKTFHIQNEP